ncbi:MAG: peptidyl-prolyl cis-trans isomerase [Gammaproteobacteria bacterium]|nr:peptidyl-prolyl cis-trans isomerase [Gammaproteobacteria bacterium]
MPHPIRINGREIREEAIRLEMPFHPAASAGESWQRSAVALSVRALLLDEAARLGIEDAATPGDGADIVRGDDARIARLLEQELHYPEPSATECRTWYDNNRQRFTTPSAYRAAHILLPAPPDDLVQRRIALRRASRLLRILARAPERFARLARSWSRCPSAASGGSLGLVGPGETCPEFERALDRAPIGQVAPEPIETRYGWHIVLLLERLAGQPREFDEVRDTIACYLRETVWRRAVAQYLKILAGRAEVEGIDLAAADSPLVQ